MALKWGLLTTYQLGWSSKQPAEPRQWPWPASTKTTSHVSCQDETPVGQLCQHIADGDFEVERGEGEWCNTWTWRNFQGIDLWLCFTLKMYFLLKKIRWIYFGKTGDGLRRAQHNFIRFITWRVVIVSNCSFPWQECNGVSVFVGNFFWG